MKKWFKFIGIMTLTLTVAASLMGCRISPALIDTVYTADADEVDPNPTARDFTDDGTEDNDAPQEREEDTAEETHSETDQAQQEDSTQEDSDYQNTGDSYSDESVEDASHTADNDSAGNSESAGVSTDTSGVSDSADGVSNDTVGDNTGNAVTDANNSDDVSDYTDNTNSADEAGQNQPGDVASESDAPVKDVPKKVVTDSSGTEQEIPEDVYTVTAVGAAAPIVAMVGGVGRLVGTSESFADNELGSMLLAASADTEVNIWWSDDGSAGISDEDFRELLYASPDVCFEISGEATFSSEQILQLQEHGIGYLVLPQLSSSENMKDAVMIVAEALETNEDTGQSAVTIANQYGSWVDECLSETAGMRATLNYYTIYISEWREDVTFTRKYDPGYTVTGTDGIKLEYLIVDFPLPSGVVNGTGRGVAVALNDGGERPFGEFWVSAGVYNLYNLAHYGSGEDIYINTNGSSIYVFPYRSWFGVPEFSDRGISDEEENLTDELSLYYALRPNLYWGKYEEGAGTNPYYHLGSSDRFSAIVVADEETKAAISNSPQWKAGFLDGTSVEEYAIDIAGDYDIYVNPTGFDNWAEGSVDSPLEAYWILCKISGGISESRLISEVRSFYSEFYGITLSDSQIENIINQ
ncbi:MAG: MSCRAMM family adhesin SdrC [Clostridiales bacterium]|nr:MSCRAMM family adhesin SdrC [Clostridiales bacterium]